MEIGNTSWEWVAGQIPLALLLAILTIYFLRHLKDTQKDMLDFMKSQADQNQKWYEAQQSQNRESLGRLAEEIKSNKVETMKELVNLTQRVDGVLDKAMIFERLSAIDKGKS